MFQHAYATITDWPVVVQGAMGSALFAVLLYLGQKTIDFCSVWIRVSSRKSKRSYLLDELFRLHAVSASESIEQAKYASILVFRAFRYFVKALMWLTLGLALGTVFSVLSVVGYLGCLFYLFKSLNIVSPLNKTSETEQQLEAIDNEIRKLDAKT